MISKRCPGVSASVSAAHSWREVQVNGVTLYSPSSKRSCQGGQGEVL